MTPSQSSGLPPAPRDVAVTLPTLGNQVTRTVVRHWLKKQWTDGFPTGTPLAELGTGEVLRAPCAGYLRWTVAIGKPVRVGDRLALIRRLPETPVPQITLGTDLDTKQPVQASTKLLASGCYVLGVQGMGKSSLLVEAGRQLLELGESVIVFDPHGKLIDDMIARMPQGRLAETYYLDLKDRQYPFALNVFACADSNNEEERDRTRNQVMHAFEKLWPETKTQVYFDKLLRHIVILLIEFPHLTLADVPDLLTDTAFRARHTEQLRNERSRNFWRTDYDRLTQNQQQNQTRALLTRIDQLTSEPVLSRILCQPKATLHIRSLIEKRKNLFVRLPINEDAYTRSAEMVGTLLMAMVYAATFSFADLPEDHIPGFSLIVDEFQNFATDEYARLFAQGRKYKVKQFLAHQYRDQLTEAGMEQNKAATLTAQTKVIFKVHPADAREVSGDFVPLQERRQHVNLDVAPLAVMHKHPRPAVKEFASRYGQALLTGAGDKYSSSGLTRRQQRDPYYADWPLFFSPVRDFGGGSVSFAPSEAATVVKLLNELFYHTEKDGRVDKARVQAVLSHMIPLLGERNKAARAEFAHRLRDVLQALLQEPITVGRSSTADKDVSQALQQLAPRQAYVRVGTKSFVLQTRELPPPVSAEEAIRRVTQLRDQTRRDLCRRVSDTVPVQPEEAETAPQPPDSDKPADKPVPQAEHPSEGSVIPLRPRSRRSRPLPEGD